MSMRIRRLLIVAFLTIWLGMSLAGLAPVFAQEEGEPARPPAGKTRKLNPQERRQLQERYRRFKQLPPEEQQRLRRRQKEFESLTDEQKQQLRRRGEFLRELSPDQRA
ncbi:MAG: DUF3106 domain-containing protein, partial [Acidobacteriales bacterium]|nr:DUF3106 domain-containing protein [Terriglobales bacterium]